jgi:hypothetical protein
MNTKSIIGKKSIKIIKNRNYKDDKYDKQIKIIQNFYRVYINKLKSLPNIKYLKYDIKYESINSFRISTKNLNDKNNKIRELIIGAIINSKIPISYYKYSRRWNNLKNGINLYINKMLSKYNLTLNTISCIHKGGRKYNYDFNMIINDTNIFNIELKFNVLSIDESPQFVSPMKPSKYLSGSYEEYFYDNYIQQISELGNLHIPNKNEYLSNIHSTKPSCLNLYQEKYYKGCKKSSKYTNKPEDIIFYQKCKELSKESIVNFINNYDIKLEKLSEYLKNTQENKIYMLYKNNNFNLETIDLNNYELLSCEKKANSSSYIATSKTQNTIKILLRWKNGNGIAFPAFQIS